MAVPIAWLACARAAGGENGSQCADLVTIPGAECAIVGTMPELSRFDGIVISMYYDDHAPPHFHAWCRGHKISVMIETGYFTGAIDPLE